MSKRSIRKVRHYAPAPSIKDRVVSAKSVETGGDGINLMEIWRGNVPRYYQEKEAFIEVQEDSNV